MAFLGKNFINDAYMFDMNFILATRNILENSGISEPLLFTLIPHNTQFLSREASRLLYSILFKGLE